MKAKILAGLIVAACLGFAHEASATWHLYVLPIVTDQSGTDSEAKYTALAQQTACGEYGRQPIALCAFNVDSAIDQQLQAAPDVFRIPDNLDQRVPANVISVVQNALENRNIPAQWVDTLHTYRDVIRIVNGMFALLRQYRITSGSNNLVFGGAVNLNTTMNQLPATVRNNLRAAGTALGLDISSIAGNTPLREALQIIGEQFLNNAFVLGGITI